MTTIRNIILFTLLSWHISSRAQNVYDTYNPSNDSVLVGYPGFNSNPGYEGEYQLFTSSFVHWTGGLTNPGGPPLTIWYKIEPVSFPFLPDCPTSDCGDSTSSIRNLTLPSSYSSGRYMHHYPFNLNSTVPEMSEPTFLLTKNFANTDPPSGSRDTLPHTILKHTYYLRLGSNATDPAIDSIVFILDHTRGYMSEYPFRPNNGDASEGQYDIAIHPWIVYPSNDSFITIPAQSRNFLSTYDYFPYPDPNHFPTLTNSSWNQIPDTTAGASYIQPDVHTHPSPYSLVGILLGNLQEGPFAGTNNFQVYQPGAPHTYYIDQALDLTEINSKERTIYNPSAAYITANTPVIFPSGYTFMTVGAKYPTQAQVEALNPDTMYPDLRKVPITGTALNLTDNPNTAAIDNLSFYYVTSGSTLIIESCVTIYDATIVVQSGGTIELDTNNTYGNFVLQLDSGSTLVHTGTSPDIACKYLCYESSNYNQRQITISSNTTWDTTNIESVFPGTGIWTPATNNTVKFAEGITIDSGATLTLGPGVHLMFGPEAGVTIKKGGRLLAHGTSTDSIYFGPACQMEWKGIQIWGDPTASQQTTSGPTHQGFLDIDYCVLTHAKDAAVAGNPDSSGCEGGMIDADRCTFVNNVRDIVLLPYRNYNPNSVATTLRNRSQITRSAFLTTDYFFDPSFRTEAGRDVASGAHISFFGVKFATIQDCIFSNEVSENYDPHLRGTGIYAIESGFNLMVNYPCTFENLSDGIIVQSSGMDTKVAYITGTTFNNNIHGVVMEGTRNCVIAKNEFDVPESPQFGYATDELEKGYDKPVGVFMIGSVDYIIAENDFNVGDTAAQITPTSTCSNCSYDIVVYHSAILDTVPPYFGIGTGRVYKNKMHHASVGLQLQGDNGQYTSSTGVQVMCNDFDELLVFDLAAIGSFSPSAVTTTVRDQGTCAGLASEQCGNHFDGNCSAQEEVYHNSSADNFLYSDHVTSFPDCFNVNQDQCVSVDTNGCPSLLTWGWYFPFNKTKYTTATTNHQTARHELDSLIDAGDTDSLLDRIENGNPSTLYDDMMDLSPWISDEALLLLLEMRDVLSDAQITEIFIANSGLSTRVLNDYTSADPEFSEELLGDLWKYQTSPSPRIVKENIWRNWLFEADIAATEMTIYALINDTVAIAEEALKYPKTIPETQKLFILTLASHNTNDAKEILTDIVAAQQGIESSWTMLAAASVTQTTDNRSWLSATNQDYHLADSIYNSNPERYIGSRSVVSYYTQRQFTREPFGLENDARQGVFTESQDSITSAAPNLLIYPNPASNVATIVVEGSADEFMTLEILNTLGQTVAQFTVKSGITMEIDLSPYAPGMLYLRLSCDGLPVATDKLMITK